MTIIDKIKDLLRMLAENIHKRRKVVLALSCVVVFVTTYMLILPAFTLEKTKAAEQGGIDVPGVTATAEDVDEEDADANDGQADAQDVQTESGKTEDGKVEDSGSKSKDSGEAKADSAQTADPLTFEDEHYTIAVDDKNSVLPENTEIKVEEIDKNEDAKKYQKHFDDALAAIQEEKDGENVSDLEFARFYDISLVSDGKEVTLGNGDKVSVNIEYDKELRKALGVENKDNIRIIHFAENKDTGKVEAEVLDNKEAKVDVNTDKKDQLKEASFEAESFSVYAVVYTVDFEYEDEATHEVYKYSMEGGSSITLKKLAVILGITAKDKADEFIANVEDVKFSDEKLVKVENTDNGWTLKSLKAFDTTETLTITMKDGSVYEVKVTDAQTNATNDLNNTVQSVEIAKSSTGESIITDDGKLIVKNNESYDFTFAFSESLSEGDTDGYQFINTDDLYYTLPDGVSIPEGTNGTFSIVVGKRVVSGNTYEVVKTSDGKTKIKVNFNKNHKNFRFLQNSTDVHFSLTFSGSISNDATSLSFDYQDKHKYEIEHQTKHNASVRKTGYFSEADNKMHYKVIIHSTDGDSNNVNVLDTLSGSALSNTQITGVYVSDQNGNKTGDNVNYTSNNAENGFDITVEEVKENKYVTVEYTADVDYSKIANNGKATFSETGNKVKIEVPGDEDTTDNESSHEEPGIKFSSISKVSTATSDVVDENGDPWTEGAGQKYRKVTWKVTANTEGKVSLKGSDITDTLLNNNEVEYFGEGISVVKITNGTHSAPINVSWADVGVTDKKNAGNWAYHATDDGNVGYEITYQTLAKVPDGTNAIEVSNVAKDKYDDDTGKVTIQPDTHEDPGKQEPKINKYATSATSETTTWKITVDIPAGWSGPLVVKDTLPSSNNDYFDSVNSVIVDGYTEGTDYTKTINQKTVTVYKDGQATVKTVDESVTLDFGTIEEASENRTISITIVTNNDQEWVNSGESWRDNHTNTAQASDGTNPYGKPSSDSSQPKPESLTKIHTQDSEYDYIEELDQYNNPITKEKLPIFGFEVGLTGVTSDPIDIQETFNTDIFEIYPGNPYMTYQGADNLKIYYSSNVHQKNEANVKATSASTDTGAVIHIENLPKTTGNAYYGFYWVRYYLAVKPGKLDEFKEYVLEHGSAIGTDGNITSKKYTFENFAAWGVHESKAEFNYTVSNIINKTGTDNNDGTYSYKIKLNPDKLKINGGANIELADALSGIVIDPNTINITASNAAGDSVPFRIYASNEEAAADESFEGICVVYNSETDTIMSVEIPDETSVEITYNAASTGDVSINKDTKKAEETVTNTATVLDYEYTVSFTHEYDFISKNKKDNDDGSVTFTIDFNQNKLKLKGGNDITLTDTFTGNLTVDNDSFKVEVCDPDTDGAKAATILSSKRLDGNTYTFTIPDKTHVKITYTGTPDLQVDENGTIQATYSNTAEAEDVPVTVDGEVDSFIIKKSAGELITTADADDEDAIGFIPFTIEFNPLKQKLNDGNDLELTDRYSGLLVDYSSIKTYVNGELRTDLDYDFTGYTGTFIIPDESYIKITYYARPDFSAGTEVDWSNIVEAHGYSDEQHGTSEQTSSGEGAASQGNEVFLYKYESGHMNRPIDGVKFQLFYDDKGTRKPVTNDAGENVYFTTENDATMGHGYVYVALTQENGFANRTLEQDQIYYLVEVPDETTGDYYPNTTVYNFVIHDDLVKDPETDEMVPNAPYVKPSYMEGTRVYVFGKGDIVKVANDKISDEVTAEKYWVNADGSWTWPKDISSVVFKIQKKLSDGSLVDLTGENIPEYYVDNEDGAVWSDTLESTKNMAIVKWTHLDRLNDNESYVVSEVSVNGNEVVDGKVTINGRTYDVNGGTVVNGKTYITNSEITSITFEKKWELPSDTILIDPPEGATVEPRYMQNGKVAIPASELRVKARLHRYIYKGGDKLNTYDFSEDDANYNVTLSGDNLTKTWDNLPTAGVDESGNEIDYIYEVEEAMVTVPTSIMWDAEGNNVDIKDVFKATSQKEGNKLTITNTIEDDNYYLRVSKEWKDYAGKPTTGEPIRFQLLRDSVITTRGGGASDNGKPATVSIKNQYDQSEIKFSSGTYTDSNETIKIGDTVSIKWHAYFKADTNNIVGASDYSEKGYDNNNGTILTFVATAANVSIPANFQMPNTETYPIEVTCAEQYVPSETTDTVSDEVLKPDTSGSTYVVDSTGTYEFTLSPNETKTFANLPHTVVDGDTTTTYTYRVVETSTGSEWHAIVSTGDYDPAPVNDDEAGHSGSITLVNQYDRPQLKDYDFTKVWKDAEGNEVAWPDGMTINVKLNAYTDTSQKAITDIEASLNPKAMPTGWTAETSTDGKQTKFKITGLASTDADGNELHYYLTEAKVEGYKNPVYGFIDSNGAVQESDNTRAESGHVVINKPEESYELPHTGGIGTVIFYVLGSILVIGGGIYFISRRRAMK